MIWTVYLKTAGAGGLSDDDIDRLLDAVGPHHGAVSGGEGSYSLQMDASGETAFEALRAARETLERIADRLDLPDWPVVHAEVMTVAEQQADLARLGLPSLVGVAEVADILGVSKQRASTLAREHGDFPAPAVKLASGPVWYEAGVRGFLERWERRPGRRKAATASSVRG